MPFGIASVVYGRKWKVREGTGNNSNCIPNISLQKGSQKRIGYLLQLKIHINAYEPPHLFGYYLSSLRS